MNSKSVAIFLILSIFILDVQSQQVYSSKENTARAEEHIKALNEGVLLVRLPTNKKKIEALTALLNDTLSEKEYASVSKLLNNSIEENENLHIAVIHAMHGAYTFSEYAFFLDFDTPEVLKDGKKLFLSYPDKLKAEYEMKPGTNFYIMTIGQTSDNSINALIIKDKEMNDIALPFPGTILRHNWSTQITRKLQKKIYKLDKKLWRFFNLLPE